MPHLSLSVLGPFQATIDGEPLTGLTSARARALLAYLAVESDRAHRRGALAALLWPDQPEQSALGSLRHALAQLRRALGERQATSPFLLVTRDAIQFSRASDHWLDVSAFQSLLTQTDSGQGDVTALEQAISLYRDELLAGFPPIHSSTFDGWLAFQRADLGRQALLVLQQLAASSEAAGDLPRAEAFVRRQLALEPWREEAHRDLMRLLAALGQRSAALAQYEVCRRVLRQELDAEPDRATVSLYEQLRDGRFQPSAVGTPVSAASPSREVTGMRRSSVVNRPFVAREAELAWLDGHLADALGGNGRAVFVTGEAGSGKTELMAEFARRAMQAHGDLIVATGTCNAHIGIGDPYLPFREVLQMLLGDVEAKRAGESISPEQARRLWALFPDALQALAVSGPDLVNRLVPGQPLLARAQAFGPAGSREASLAEVERLVERKLPRPGEALEQNDLFEQVTRFLLNLARRQTLLLLLDDLQWADKGSISLLFHLGRRVTGCRILVLGAFRTDEVLLGSTGERHPLEPVVNELTRDLGEVILDLSHVDSRRFVDELLDAEPNRLAASFRDRLHLLTGGHALFTVELLRGLVERGDLAKDKAGCWVEGPGLDWEHLPARVGAVIAERVGRLPRELQGLLEVASVEGEAFTAEIVARVRGCEERYAVQQLSGALRRSHRLVVARSVRRVGAQRLSGYGFRHSLFQQYLYGRLDEVERAELHEAVGLAMEELHGAQAEEVAVQLARHFEAAGLAEKAVHFRLQAANAAIRVSAHTEALGHLGRGLSLLTRIPEGRERDRFEMDLRLASFLPLLKAQGWGSPELAQAIDRGRQLGEGLGDTDRLQSVLGLLGFLAIGRAHHGTAVAFVERLISLAESTGSRVGLSVAHRLMGTHLLIQGEPRRSLSHMERAASLYDPCHERSDYLPAPTLVLTGMQCEALVLWMLGYPVRSARCAEEAISYARAAGDPETLRVAITMHSASRFLARDHDAAQRSVEEAERQVVDSGGVQLPAWLAVLRGRVQVGEGHVDSGLALIRTGIDGWRSTRTMPAAPWHLYLLADACLVGGKVELGLGAVQEAAALRERGEGRGFEAEFRRLEGELLLAGGGVSGEAAAEECYRLAIAVAQRQEAKMLELRAALSLARLLAGQGRRREARDLLDPVYAWFTEGLDTADLVDARTLLDQLG